MTARHEITARLLQGGVAGPHRSHQKEDNVLKASQLASGEPDSTFGMPELASATTGEGLDAVAAVTGAREPGEPYIDPEATIAGVQAASARLGEACRNGATIIVASGHPARSSTTTHGWWRPSRRREARSSGRSTRSM